VLALGAARFERTVGDGRVNVDDDGGVLGVGLLLDSGEGAEELIGDVSHDGGALGGDAVLGKKAEKFCQKALNLRSGLEFTDFAEEIGGEVGGFAGVLLEASVIEAEAGGGVGDKGLAAASGRGAALATSGLVDRIGVSGLLVHFDPR